jgi:hypothetical protein
MVRLTLSVHPHPPASTSIGFGEPVGGERRFWVRSDVPPYVAWTVSSTRCSIALSGTVGTCALRIERGTTSDRLTKLSARNPCNTLARKGLPMNAKPMSESRRVRVRAHQSELLDTPA